MTIERIHHYDRETWLRSRQQDITASAAGALFGIHDFMTPYELWAEKTGRLPSGGAENDAMRRGRLLEPVAVQILEEERPLWTITHNSAENIYYRDPDARIGGTPDVRVMDPNRGPGVVQIKSVESGMFRQKWMQDGEIEVPLWISLQATIEAHLTGSKWAAVAPLVIGHGVEMPIIDIPLVPEIIDAVEEETAEFWARIARGEEPDPDFSADGGVISRLYPEAAAGTQLDMSENHHIETMIMVRAAAKEKAKEHEAVANAAEAEIKHTLGNFEAGLLPSGKRVTWKTQNRKEYIVEAASFRVLRCPTIY